MRRRPRLAALAGTAASLMLLTGAPAHGNDSEAAIGLGGLELVQSADISMDSEDLYISADEVRVRYRFTNHAARDVETLVSFPVPAIPGGMGPYFGESPVPDFKRLEFRTTIDGKPVALDSVERAEIKGRDVTARITALGWPMGWYQGDDETPAFMKRLTAAQRTAFAREGLLRTDPNNKSGLIPAWDLVTHVTRKQTFPAGKSVIVTHRYVPFTGGSVAGGLDPQFRKDAAADNAQYCLDKSFFTAFDKRQAEERKRYGDEVLPYSETWISYILSSGRNWRGPIKDFRLVVDKGIAKNLVSFCMDGVKKISPTQFEVRKTNFEPKKDLHIMVVSWANDE